MKTIKKMLALATTLALVFTMVVATAMTAFAADPYTITVNGAKAGETYTAYKMLDLTVDDPANPTAFSYTVNSAWAAFANTAEFKAFFNVDDQGYVTTKNASQADQPAWNGTSDFSKLADAAAKFAKDNSIAAAASVTIADGATSGVLDITGPGYYVISSTMGTRAMTESTPSNAAVTINEKNEEDIVEKTVKEDSTGNYGSANDAQVGDTVEFISKTKVVARSVNVKIHDVMEAGLTLDANSVKVYTDEACTTEYTAAQVKTGTAADTGDTFTVVVPDSFAATATDTQYLYVKYSAVVNKDAVVKDENGNIVIDPQTNTPSVSFGDNTTNEGEPTTTTTHKFEVLKYKASDSTKKNLADAIFTLKKGSTVIKLIKIDEKNYRVADATEASGTAKTHVGENGTVATVEAGSLVSDFVTVASGNIVIWGVDSDNDYVLTEIQAPNGYNLLKDPVTVTVNKENSTVAEVPNASGTELPATGGIGTTIFYILGSLLVVGCGIVLVSRKRMQNNK